MRRCKAKARAVLSEDRLLEDKNYLYDLALGIGMRTDLPEGEEDKVEKDVSFTAVQVNLSTFKQKAHNLSNDYNFSIIIRFIYLLLMKTYLFVIFVGTVFPSKARRILASNWASRGSPSTKTQITNQKEIGVCAAHVFFSCSNLIHFRSISTRLWLSITPNINRML